MTLRIHYAVIGHAPGRPRLHPNEDPTYAQFEAEGHCCDGCVDGCAGSGRSSSSPVNIQVAFVDDMPEGSLDVEIRWEAFGKPQRLLLDTWAADALASALRQAHQGDGHGWKAAS